MQVTTDMRVVGEQAHLASADEIAAGITAAMDVFARHNADPSDCAAANGKMERDELLTREEALQCVIWGEAEDAAFYAVTLGWLARDVDIRISLK